MKRMNMLTDLAAIGVIAVISLGSGLLVNSLRSQPIALVYASPEQRLQSQLTEIVKSPPFRVTTAKAVSLDEFRTLALQHRALVLDARAKVFYQDGHVPGALNLSREDFARDYEHLRSVLEARRDKPIVVYCSGGDCYDSRMVASALLSLGFSNVRFFPGGWEAWTAAKLPVAR